MGAEAAVRTFYDFGKFKFGFRKFAKTPHITFSFSGVAS
jgi:hypothetical protein